MIDLCLGRRTAKRYERALVSPRSALFVLGAVFTLTEGPRTRCRKWLRSRGLGGLRKIGAVAHLGTSEG
jgi:hypothetical protein